MTAPPAVSATPAPSATPSTRASSTSGMRHGGSPDAQALRLIAAARVVLVTGFAAVGSALPDLSGEERTVAFGIALIWLPWALIVFIASDSPKRRIGRYGGWLGDLAALGVAIALVPQLGSLSRFLILIAVLTGLYCCPELPVWGPAGLGMAAATGGELVDGIDSAGALRLLLFALILAVVATLWRLLASRDREAAAVATWLRDRADTIVDHMPEPVVLTDGGGRVLRWNPVCGSALDLHGSQGERCGVALGLHYGERPLDCSTGCALLSLVGTGADRSVEVWRPVGGNQRQPLLASVTPVVDPAGRISEVVHCFRDITRLKEADEAKTLFLATASHELKTPLTVIRGFGELLHSGRLTDPEGQTRAFEAIHIRSVELARVVDRLLLSSRIDAGRLTVRLERVDVRDIVTARATAFESSTRRPVQVTFGDVTEPAWADTTALSTVIDHLLDNAMKYSPDGQVVEVRVAGAPDSVRVEITDHGIGMTAEHAAHCFEKFWQADSGDRRRFGGTGIGLYIVRSLVESMGGRIDVTSAPGFGSTFGVSLSLAQNAAVPEQRAPLPPPERSIIREFMRQIGVPGEGGRP